MSDHIPVTVLSGTLGAGKTTLLNRVLGGNGGPEVAVLVNDVGDVNVDAEVIERHTGNQEVVELSNGCICCGLQGELEHTVIDLALNHEFEYLLIEPSGISEPAPVARQFVEGQPSGLYRLDGVVTVVDARQFYDAFEEGEPERRGEGDDGVRPMSDLIVEGVEFCDTLVVNKTDLVSNEELTAVRSALRTLQPAATLVSTEFGAVDPELILDTGGFDREGVEGSARWRRQLEQYEEREHDDTDQDHGETTHDDTHEDSHEHDHAHPPEVYGVDSFVYHRVEPMHPGRLVEFLENTPESLLRAKGWLHVAGRPDHALELSLAGREAQVTVAGRWIASLPEKSQEQYRNRRDPHWTAEYGDRETKLVVIGRELDRDRVERRLDTCLLTDSELTGEDLTLENRFPDREGNRLHLSAADSA